MWGWYWWATCSCAVQIHHKNTAFYFDTCGVRSSSTTKTFFLRDGAGKITPQYLQNIPSIPRGRDTDDSWWNIPGNAVSVPNIRIQIARSQIPNTFVVRNTFNFIFYDRAYDQLYNHLYFY
jgi:hypothetical protein